MNAYIQFGEKLSICSQDIEQKQIYDGLTNERNDRQPKSYIAPVFQSGAIIEHLSQCYPFPYILQVITSLTCLCTFVAYIAKSVQPDQGS